MLFQYRAIKDGKTEKKKIEAESEESIVEYLHQRGYFLIQIQPITKFGSTFLTSLTARISFNDIVDFTRQLAIMLNSGLSIIDSLSILKKQATKPSLQTIIFKIDKRIRSGSNMSDAFSQYPQYFSKLYISLVRAGEASGKLDEILLKLSDNLEKEREFKGKLRNALIYPAVIIVAMVAVMFIMITFVVPKLLELYKQFDVELPLTTQLLIVTSDFTSQFWPVILMATGGGIFLFRQYLKTKAGKMGRDRFLMHIPVIKNVVQMGMLVNSTRTLSILIGSGVSILESLTIVAQATDNYLYRDAFMNVYKSVEKGKSLGSSLQDEHIFPPILVQMAMVGENTGHLDDSLRRLSHYFEMESEITMKGMTTLIEPLILVVLGISVGFIVFSVITPIYNLTSSFN